ncbi:flagellar motor protein MotA [Xanthomonadaceae bacterium XH05]|nr:flagellar motor protein MotA [Xanthomonadaceae bacterium XH05]
MSQPSRVLLSILAVLAAIALIAVLLHAPLLRAFSATPIFNAVILGVFLIGVAANLRQVMRLQREVEWIEAYRRSNPERTLEAPVLLAPMARMLGQGGRKPQSLSTQSMRSILDSIHLRLEEQRDLSRYLVGLLIFLGLLGTFWGLLITIASVGEIIAGLGAGSEATAMFDALKSRLQQPLSGMATSFSTSLFGLGCSLVLGLIDLLAGRAANRFYTEVEDWLSGMTRLSSGSGIGEGDASVPAYVQALLEQTADGLERMQRALVESERERRGNAQQMAELNTHLARLSEHLGRESRGLSDLAETQAELRNTFKILAQRENNGTQLSDELRAEFRLLSRTLAAAVESRR